MFVRRFENTPISSNCFVIYTGKDKGCLVIDPGTEDCSNIIPFLDQHSLNVEYCFLTHEHIDHAIGLKLLKDKYDCKVICSTNCAAYLNDTKYNLSEFEERFEPISSFPTADVTFDSHLVFNWHDMELKMDVMLGHSRGSSIMLAGKDLFIGDNLIKGMRTKANYFGGSKEDLLVSLETLLERLGDSDLIVHSGHFDSCPLAEIKPEIEEQIAFLKRKLQKDSNRTDVFLT